MNGESPTLPAGLNGIPPVEVPAARSPARSSAIAPTVSCPNIVSTQFGSGCARRSSQIARSRSDTRSSGSHVSTPARSANWRAPGPVNTANGLSSTRRASVIAWGMPRTETTEPTWRAAPSMIPASSSMKPSSLSAEPRPAPKIPDPSSSRTAALDGIERRAAFLQHLPAGAGRRQAALAMAAVLGRGDVEGAAVDRDRRRAVVGSSCGEYLARWGRSPSGRGRSSRGRPSRGIAPTADRARPACAAAEVGSTKRPCASSARSDARIVVVAHLDDVAAGRRGSRRGSASTAAGGRSGCPRRSSPRRDGDRVGVRRPGTPGPAARRRRSARRRGAARRSIRPASRRRAKPRWTPSSSVPPPSGATTRVRRPAAELLEDLVGEGRGAGEERRLPEVRAVRDVRSGVLERPRGPPHRPPTAGPARPRPTRRAPAPGAAWRARHRRARTAAARMPARAA